MRSRGCFFLLCCVSPSFGLLTGCSPPSAPAPADAGKPETPAAPPSVTVTHPKRMTLRQVIQQPGHVEAFEQTPIYAKIPGYVRTVNVDIDDKVEEGQVLVELSVPEMVEEAAHKKDLALVAAEEVKQARHERVMADAKVEK